MIERSSTEPVLSSDTRALEKRWARDPVTGEEMKVPADMTYREWEKKMKELRGADAVVAAEKKIRNTAADRKQWINYKHRLGREKAPASLDEFQKLKYNNIAEYTSMKKSYRTIGELQDKPWNDAFKGKAVNAYWDAKEKGMEFSSHAVGRFLDRVKAEGYDSPMDRVVAIMGKGTNYYQGADRAIRYYEELAIVTDRQSGDIVTFMNRKNPKKEWEEIK